MFKSLASITARAGRLPEWRGVSLKRLPRQFVVRSNRSTPNHFSGRRPENC